MADGRYALIVASSRYSDATLTQLEAPAYDARTLSAALAAPGIGDFEVTTLTDQPAPAVMQEIEAFFDGRRREDLVLLYFSGHGILDQSARLYFATTDTRVDRPRSTAVSADFVNELMGECRSRRQVLVLDCCNSGAFARGIKAGGRVGTGDRFEGRGRVVITASDALQYAFETGRVEGDGISSIFTQSLVNGLETGEADLNRDGNRHAGRALRLRLRTRTRRDAAAAAAQVGLRRRGADRDRAYAPRERRRGGAGPPAPGTCGRADGGSRASQPPRRRTLRPRYLVGAVAALAAAAAAATAIAVVAGGGDSASKVADGREAILDVYEAWLDGDLGSLGTRVVSNRVKDRLSLLPTDPVTPSPPVPDDCWGDPDDVTCTSDYADPLPMHLLFRAVKERDGMRVAEVGCFDGDGDEWSGGMAACGRLVAEA